jgi:2-C-methyl-D-erythritol 4-phosphate cytidylyltransferase
MPQLPNAWLIIVAGGSGQRMGAEVPKQFLPLADKPILARTVEAFLAHISTKQMLVVLPQAHFEAWISLCLPVLPDSCRDIRLVAGGDTRSQSVLNALDTLAELQLSPETLVGIHDGVRPMVSPLVIESTYSLAAQTGAAIPVVPIVPTLREYLTNGSSQTVDRSRFCEVQTPQVFRYDWLVDAYKRLNPETLATDDAGVVELEGYEVTLSEGSHQNLKITTPHDLRVASLYYEG